MHRTRIAKKFFAYVMAQMMVISMALGTTFSPLTAYAAEKTQTKIDKDEIVYVITDGDGKVDEVIVTDQLANQEHLSELMDETDLSEIENLKGDEEYTENGNAVTWKAEGNDISYQGKSNKDLPVDVNISYTLDGKRISASELAGKSGKVTIRFDYKNKEEKKVKVNGKEYSVYVPFTVISGMFLDSDKFTNVQVENGKTLKEGGKLIVFGYAMPGWKDSLGIGDEILKDEDEKDLQIDFPEYIEVTADVTDFELGMTMTAVTNDLMNEMDSVDQGEIQDQVDSLEDATNTLIDGTGELHDGTDTAYTGAKKIADNMKKLSGGVDALQLAVGMYTNGVGKLYQGLPSLTEGVSVLNTGASKLAYGANSLKEGTEEYVKGVNTLAGGLLGDGSKENPGYLAGVEQLAEGAKALSALSGLPKVSNAITQMAAATDQKESYIDAEGKQKPTLGYGAAALEAGLTQVISNIEGLKGGVAETSLQQLAGALGTAASMMERTKGKTEQASTIITDAAGTVSDAASEVKTQAEHVTEAKGELEKEKASLDQEITERNESISSKNKGIAEAQKDANVKINSSLDETIEELESAKKALVNAQTEELKFPEQIASIDAQIAALKTKKSPLSVTENAISSLEKTETKINDSEISDAKLIGYADTLANKDFSSVDLTQEKAVITQIADKISAADTSMAGASFDQLLAGLNQLKAGAGSVRSGVNALHGNLVTLESATKDFPAAAEGIKALNQGFDTVTANNQAIRRGADQLVKNGPVLVSGAKEVANGAVKMSGGTQTLQDGSSVLVDGVATLVSNNDALNKGADTLSQGASLLSDGSASLTDGMSKLLDGTQELKEGMERYKEDGIQKIVDLYRNDILGLEDRFEAVKQAGREYQTYTQLAEGMKGSVKFIYKSEEIKK